MPESELRLTSTSALILLVLASCSPPKPQPIEPVSAALTPPTPPAASSEARATAPVVDGGSPSANAELEKTPAPLYRVWPRSVSLPRTAGETDRVLRAVFPKYLEDRKQCRPFHGGSSWGEIDELIGKMWKAGQFVPTVEERVSGSFTAASTSEVLYRISIAHCTQGLDAYRVFAIFDATDAGALSGPVKLRFGDALLASEDWRILAVVPNPGGPSHLLVAHDAWSRDEREGPVDRVREVVLARPGVVPPELDPQLAHLRARAVEQWHGVNAVWRTVAEFRDPPPDSCTTYRDVAAASDAGSRVRAESEPCTAP